MITLPNRSSGGSTAWNVDLSEGKSDFIYTDEYVIFGGGSLTLVESADFPNIPFVSNIAQARKLIPIVQSKIHRLLISYGGENDSTWDQIASSNYIGNTLSASANVKVGSLLLGTTDVDELGPDAFASEYFICPFARDAAFIYFITCCYTLSSTYAPNTGNKFVQFYTGVEGDGLAAPYAALQNTGQTANLRFSASLTASARFSVLVPLRFKV